MKRAPALQVGDQVVGQWVTPGGVAREISGELVSVRGTRGRVRYVEPSKGSQGDRPRFKWLLMRELAREGEARAVATDIYAQWAATITPLRAGSAQIARAVALAKVISQLRKVEPHAPDNDDCRGFDFWSVPHASYKR